MAEDLLPKCRPFDPEFKATRSGAGKRIEHANTVVVVARGKGSGFLSDHAGHVMLLRILGNSFHLGTAFTAPHFCTTRPATRASGFCGGHDLEQHFRWCRHVRLGDFDEEATDDRR
jgi:hypothetical protein